MNKHINKFANFTSEDKRIGFKSAAADVNQLDADFQLRLKSDKNVKVIDFLNNENILVGEEIEKIYLGSDDSDNVINLKDIVTKEFNNKKKFTFIFSLNGHYPFHVYKYDVKLNDNKNLTSELIYRIICNSSKHILQDTLEYIKEKKFKNIFDIEEKLNQLEIYDIYIKIKKNTIFVEFSGFEAPINPFNTI